METQVDYQAKRRTDIKIILDLLNDIDYIKSSLPRYIDPDSLTFICKSSFCCKVKFLLDLCKQILSKADGKAKERQEDTKGKLRKRYLRLEHDSIFDFESLW